jgi:serine/threonine protein phosphatase 1
MDATKDFGRGFNLIDINSLTDTVAGGSDAIYVVGDIHGRLDLLIKLEDAIKEDVSKRGFRSPVICYLGDYIDRGPSSSGVVDYLIRKSREDFFRVFLKGNHEDRLLDFLIDPAGVGKQWLNFGGREALASYGIAPPEEPSNSDWLLVGEVLFTRIPKSHHDFYRELRLGLRWQNYFFVHAGLNPEISIHAQKAHDLMWIREPFLSSAKDYGVRVVHGHSLTASPDFRVNRIGIDTGAYRTGTLTALVVTQSATEVIAT